MFCVTKTHRQCDARFACGPSQPRSLPLPPVAAAGRVDGQPTLVGALAVAGGGPPRGPAVAAGVTAASGAAAASTAPAVSHRFVGGVVALIHVINIICDRTTGIVAVVLAAAWTAASPASAAATPHRTAAGPSAAVHVGVVAAVVPPTH